MRKSSLWRMLVNVARVMLLFAACIALLVTVSRADTAACLRILNYSNGITRPDLNGILTLLVDADHGRVVRESRFPARTEVSFSPVANRTVYIAADIARPQSASLIVQSKSGIFSEDQIVQRGMVNDYFEYVSDGARRMVWSKDGKRLAYLWRRATDQPEQNISPWWFSVLDVDTGDQVTEPLSERGEFCCLGTFSPDLNYITVRPHFSPDTELNLWSTRPLLSIDPLTRWLAGTWLPNGHEFVGIGYPSTPSELHFMRWSDTMITALPISNLIPRRLVLGAFLSPDGKSVAFQSIPTMCANPVQTCNMTYLFDIFTIDGQLIGSDLSGLQLVTNRSSANFADPTPNALGWSPDGKQFLYLHESTPQNPLLELYRFDVEKRETTKIDENLAANYMQEAFFPSSFDRYYSPSAVQERPPYMLRIRREGSMFSVDYVALDGSKTISMIQRVNLISELDSVYTGYGRVFGWALDGRTVIIPWLRAGFSGPTNGGLVWMNIDGTNKHELTGMDNVSDVNVAVDMTTRLSSRWLGFFASGDGALNFELVNLDDERHWQVTLPAVGALNSWMTWFSRDGRYAAAYVGDGQGNGQRTSFIYLIDLKTGLSERFSNATMAAWSRESDRLAYAAFDSLSASYAVHIITPDGALRGTISLDSFDVTDVRAMSWNPCR